MGFVFGRRIVRELSVVDFGVKVGVCDVKEKDFVVDGEDGG